MQKGKNSVKIKISNGSQVIETTRDIAFYNGSVTFYDVNLNEFSGTSTTLLQSAALEYSPNFVYGSTSNKLTITGKVIVPNSYYEVTDPGPPVVKNFLPHPDPTATSGPNSFQSSFKAALKLVTSSVETDLTTGSVTIAIVGSPAVSDPFFVYGYTIELGTVNSNTTGQALATDQLYNVKLTARNESNAHLNLTPTEEGTDALYFSLRDGTKPFISEINYLPGYKPSNYESIEGVPLNGKNLYGLPIGVEILVGNPGAGLADTDLTATRIEDLYGKSITPTPGVTYTIKSVSQKLVTKTINGQLQTFQRFILEFPKMPFEGTQTITFTVTGGSAPALAKFTLLYGPFADFKTIVDHMPVYDDATKDTGARTTEIINGKLSLFEGNLQNINNTSEIRYVANTDGPRTMYFYINNVPFPILPKSGAANPNDTNFILDGSRAQDALNSMFNGENVIKLVFQSSKSYYEKVIRVNIIPTNLPIIPFDSTGVFPFTFQEGLSTIKPIYNDPKFKQQGTLYTTTEPFMNIYGTFDFIDLGTGTTMLQSYQR